MNSAPKFQLGQAVAVCTTGCRTVIARTRVIARECLNNSRAINVETGAIYLANGWAYGVADDKPGVLILEHCLRPIDPDTEYQDEEQREVAL